MLVMEKDKIIKTSLTGAQRVKQYRQIRRKAGLAEAITWLKKFILTKSRLCLLFRQSADNALHKIKYVQELLAADNMDLNC